MYGTRFHLKFAPQNKPETMCIKHRKYQSKLKEVDIWGGTIYIYTYCCIHRDTSQVGTWMETCWLGLLGVLPEGETLLSRS